MKYSLCLLGLLLACDLRTLLAFDAPPEPQSLIQRIAFGSCNQPTINTPAWDSLRNLHPDLWLWLGDTVYADDPRPEGATPEARARVVLDRLPDLYARQNNLPAYAALRARTRILGTWDDHDYGINDAGAEFVGREEAQRHFLDFYGEPVNSPRRQRPGIYASYRYGPPGRTVQVILLDTRYFRSPLKSDTRPRTDWLNGQPGSYAPTDDAAATLLGADQWRWLEATLRQPADVRLLISSIQILPDDHRFEKWGNFPAERRRLIQLISTTQAQGVVLLSGDRHTGELSRLDPTREINGAELDPGYPLYEITSSSINRSQQTTFTRQLDSPTPRAVRYGFEHNRHRIGTPLVYNHFGLISIDWENANGPLLTLALHLDSGEEVLRQAIPLKDLRPVRP
jgi:alkaline phosphatase D